MRVPMTVVTTLVVKLLRMCNLAARPLGFRLIAVFHFDTRLSVNRGYVPKRHTDALTDLDAILYGDGPSQG